MQATDTRGTFQELTVRMVAASCRRFRTYSWDQRQDLVFGSLGSQCPLGHENLTVKKRWITQLTIKQRLCREPFSSPRISAEVREWDPLGTPGWTKLCSHKQWSTKQSWAPESHGEPFCWACEGEGASCLVRVASTCKTNSSFLVSFPN